MELNHVAVLLDDEGGIEFYNMLLKREASLSRLIEPEVSEKIFGIKSRMRLLRFDLESGRIELFIPEVKVEERHQIGHFGLDVPEGTVERLKSVGIKVTEIDRGDYVLGFVCDPTKNLIELKEFKRR